MWFETIKRWLGKRRPVNAGMEGVRFIPARENAHGVDVWDCAVFTHSMISTTSDANVASQFARLRASDGREHGNQRPPSASVTDCRLAYPVTRTFTDGPLFKADAMEDKWDIYFVAPHIYFARSWTGQLIYRAEAHFEGQRLIITRIECPAVDDSESGRRTIDYLVKSHVLGGTALHPLSGDPRADPAQIAAASFSVFGRRCAVGTYADTTIIPWTTASGQPAARSAV